MKPELVRAVAHIFKLFFKLLHDPDLMFMHICIDDFIFRHLIPCTHVMVSQRRSVRDLDLYSKSAEKFLSLRPTCCLPDIGESPKQRYCFIKTDCNEFISCQHNQHYCHCSVVCTSLNSLPHFTYRN